MGFETSVAVIFFNRPLETQQLFEKISNLKPSKLFLIADGPRTGNTTDKIKSEESRNVFAQIDWTCEVHKNYSDVNLGCKERVVSGLNWVFELTDEAIILEDDCIPSDSFFVFASELLEKYRYSNEIGIICGTSFSQSDENKQVDFFDYYFSRYPKIWGWATWKHVWNLYDPNIEDWALLRKTDFLKRFTYSPQGVRRWQIGFNQVFSKKLDTWDYQLAFSLWRHNLLSITPNKNLVSNIGFGTDATHTKNPNSKFANLRVEEIKLPLSHPGEIIIDVERDKETEVNLFEISLFKYLFQKIFFRFDSKNIEQIINFNLHLRQSIRKLLNLRLSKNDENFTF